MYIDKGSKVAYAQTIKNRIERGEIRHTDVAGWAKDLQSQLDSTKQPMVMYGRPFVEESALTLEGQRHTNEFDNVIVDQNVFKFLAGFVGADKDIDKKEMGEKTIKALSELLKAGSDLTILNPGLTHPLESSVEKAFYSLKGVVFGDVSICKDTFSGRGRHLMIRFHNKKKDIIW